METQKNKPGLLERLEDLEIKYLGNRIAAVEDIMTYGGFADVIAGIALMDINSVLIGAAVWVAPSIIHLVTGAPESPSTSRKDTYRIYQKVRDHIKSEGRPHLRYLRNAMAYGKDALVEGYCLQQGAYLACRDKPEHLKRFKVIRRKLRNIIPNC